MFWRYVCDYVAMCLLSAVWRSLIFPANLRICGISTFIYWSPMIINLGGPMAFRLAPRTYERYLGDILIIFWRYCWRGLGYVFVILLAIVFGHVLVMSRRCVGDALLLFQRARFRRGVDDVHSVIWLSIYALVHGFIKVIHLFVHSWNY